MGRHALNFRERPGDQLFAVYIKRGATRDIGPRVPVHPRYAEAVKLDQGGRADKIAAHLIAWKGHTIEKDNRRSRTRQMARRRGPCRPGTSDDHIRVVTWLHRCIDH